MPAIYDTSLRDLLPSSIRDDKTVAASALAVDPSLLACVHAIPNLLLYQRLLLTAGLPHSPMLPALDRLTTSAGGLMPLSTAELEHLAWQMHVDYRELAKTDKELALMVVNSIAWHRIKGTPASIIQALAMFGIHAAIEEHDFGAHWAEYQLNLKDIDSPEIAQLAYKVAFEMQPARCKLTRIYNNFSDDRFFIWTKRGVWSRDYWSSVSGVRDESIDAVLSLGKMGKAITDPLTAMAFHARTLLCTRLVRYSRAWMWSQSRWGDALPMMHSFSHGQLASYILERMQKPWSFRGRSVVREQLTWSGNTSTVGAWSDINARYSRRAYDLVDNPPRWGSFRYGDSVGKRTVIPEERFRQIRKTVFSVPEFIATTCHQNLGGHIASLYPQNTWTGKWDSRSWTPTPPVLRKSTQI